MNNKNLRYGKIITKSKGKTKISFGKRTLNQLLISTVIFSMFFLLSKTDVPANRYIGKILTSSSDIELAKYNFKQMCMGLDEKYPSFSKNALWNGFIDFLGDNKTIVVAEPSNQKLELVAEASDGEFVYPENINMIMPVKGTVTSPFGEREHPVYGQDAIHYGVDISADKGNNIITTAPGKVIEVKVHDIYGNCVLIQHTERIKSFYAHLESVNVKEGDIVNESTVIGTVGDTGVTTGPHLHFGVRVDDIPTDPQKYINME